MQHACTVGFAPAHDGDDVVDIGAGLVLCEHPTGVLVEAVRGLNATAYGTARVDFSLCERANKVSQPMMNDITK